MREKCVCSRRKTTQVSDKGLIATKVPTHCWYIDLYDKRRSYSTAANRCINDFGRCVVQMEAYRTNSKPKVTGLQHSPKSCTCCSTGCSLLSPPIMVRRGSGASYFDIFYVKWSNCDDNNKWFSVFTENGQSVVALTKKCEMTSRCFLHSLKTFFFQRLLLLISFFAQICLSFVQWHI